MKSGIQVVHKMTIAEGLTSIEITDLLRDEPLLSGDLDDVPKEGSLLPETYHFHLGETRAVIVNRMRKALEEVLGMYDIKLDVAPESDEEGKEELSPSLGGLIRRSYSVIKDGTISWQFIEPDTTKYTLKPQELIDEVKRAKTG